jgi:predicted secreted protein
MNVSRWVGFTAIERRESGAAHPVLIEPSLDDPCTALCVIDRAPKPRDADGKLSEVS